jgi:hypothetical protein
MLNSILETRTAEDGLYNITLRINEDEYFSVYDYLDNEDASELLENYLKYRADDGRPKNIKLKHNKNEHIVTITADLHYLGNEKTEDMYNTHGYVRNTQQ